MVAARRHRDISISQTGRRDERLVSAKIFVRGIDAEGQARMIAGPQCEVSRSLLDRAGADQLDPERMHQQRREHQGPSSGLAPYVP